MPRIRGKGREVLDLLRLQAEAADAAVASLKGQLDEAEILRAAYRRSYETAEKAMASKPRQSAAKPATKPTSKSTVKVRKKRGGLPLQCAQELTNDGVCAFPEDHLIHSPNGGYSGFHPFVKPSATPSAPSPMSAGANGEPYKGPINQPCSACSAGDTAMEYHDHDYVKAENRRAVAPPAGS